MDGKQLKHASEFKCLAFALDEFRDDRAKLCGRVVSGRKVAGTLGNAEFATSMCKIII